MQHHLLTDGPVIRGRPEGKMRITAHHNDFVHTKRKMQFGQLGHDGAAAGKAYFVELVEIGPVVGDGAGCWCPFPAKGFEQGRFAGAVGAYDDVQTAGFEGERDSIDNRLAPYFANKVFDVKHKNLLSAADDPRGSIEQEIRWSRHNHGTLR